MIDTGVSWQSAGERHYDFDSVAVTISSSSEDVSGAVDRIMSRRSHAEKHPSAIAVRAEIADGSWLISVDAKVEAGLSGATAAPRVAQAMISTACMAAARRRKSILVEGAILHRAGAGLALIGEDLESVKALAFHLHGRHWTAVSFAYGFLNPETLDVTGLQTLATLSSTSIDRIPRRYRRAIEASKWYDSGRHLTFYAVDPFLVHPNHASGTTLKNVMVVDAAASENVSIEERPAAGTIGFIERHPMASSLRTATLRPGSPIATCDAIENWFSSPPES